MTMAGKTSYEVHHNFPKLADESGFAFNIHRPRGHVDWNKIRSIDIDSLVRERKFGIIEQHVSDIMNCVLESEFDVRILNEGVLKMFRLAQLAVEYQQFCRHYLDRSVYVLKEEISSLVQELEVTKKDLRDKDEEIKKLKRKTKHTYRSMPYGNENIAAMILKTLSQKNELFPSTSNGDFHQYNKCNYCDKVFLNQLYLKSHMSRRHANVSEIPQRDVPGNHPPNNVNTDNKLSEEITELKNKLKEMESLLNENKRVTQSTVVKPAAESSVPDTVNNSKDGDMATNKMRNDDNELQQTYNTPKQTKDAEVSTNSDEYLLDRIEKWKKEEHEKYNREINLLRTQILDTINALKEKETNSTNLNEPNVLDLLHKTISEQGSEITALKHELNNSKIRAEKENVQLRKESEEQLASWAKRLEAQSKQHDLLLHKLNDLAKEAQESRKQAEREKERAEYLQAMLRESAKNKHSEDNSSDDKAITVNHQKHTKVQRTDSVPNKSVKNQSNLKPDTTSKTKTISDRKTLEILHQKAQELLNVETISSSSSDISSEESAEEISQLLKQNSNHINTKLSENGKHNRKQAKSIRDKEHNSKKPIHLQKPNRSDRNKEKSLKTNEENLNESKKPVPKYEKNGPILVPRSPVKLVRAKITEEVNNRLVSAGMDPLKIRLPKNVFHKQRLVLQQQQELKSKKNPSRETVKHSILAYLDSAVSNKDFSAPDEYVSPNKEFKTLSLKSVLSNVKSKALSLVKSTDIHLKSKTKMLQLEAKRETLNGEVAKRALALLKTPPGSAHSSPALQKLSANVDKTEVVWNSNIDTDNCKSNTNHVKEKVKKRLAPSKSIMHDDTSSESTGSDHNYYKTGHQNSKSIDNLIKSPARRPASAEVDYNHTVKKFTLDNGDIGLTRTQSAINVSNVTEVTNKYDKLKINKSNEHDTDDIESVKEERIKQATSDENIRNTVKGVLKNASSTSSLNKKKVLFDMDAIQMKSVSASPSQSITEKSDGNEKYELGLINLDGEEWDISSIEDEPLKNDTKIQINTRTSPKIAELKQTIESQLARRNDTPSTVRVGAVDIAGPMLRVASSIGGSNTSLGSSILDESDIIPPPNHRAFVKPKNIALKEDSEVDISEFSIDGIDNKHESF